MVLSNIINPDQEDEELQVVLPVVAAAIKHNLAAVAGIKDVVIKDLAVAEVIQEELELVREDLHQNLDVDCNDQISEVDSSLDVCDNRGEAEKKPGSASADKIVNDKQQEQDSMLGNVVLEQMGLILEGDELYEIKNITGKGRGMFATRKIYPGEIIVREVPQIILCEEVFLDHDKCERFVEREVNKMSDKQRRRFLSLTDGRGLDSYLGIFYTNDMDWDGDVCLCPTMARANHSCAPNAEFYTRKDIGEQRLVSLCIIEEGEEITISYMAAADEGSDIRSKRQQYLRNLYGFQCSCLACSLQGEALEHNDAVREEIKELQACGIDNLDIQELEHLLKLCDEIKLKISYKLDLIEAMCNKSSSPIDKHYQSVRGLNVAINSYGVDSIRADQWRNRIEMDVFRMLELLYK